MPQTTNTHKSVNKDTPCKSIDLVTLDGLWSWGFSHLQGLGFVEPHMPNVHRDRPL